MKEMQFNEEFRKILYIKKEITIQSRIFDLESW
jgi:hypothetical protein